MSALSYWCAVIPFGAPDDLRLPPAQALVHETRAGGYVATAGLRPKVSHSDRALQSLIQSWLVPGAGALLALGLPGRPEPVRTWPAVVTAVAARAHRRRDHYPPAIVALADPFTAHGRKSLWLALPEVSPGHAVAAALSAVAGGPGRPEDAPALPGLPPIVFRTDVRRAVRTLPYVISRGETLTEWLRKLCALLKVRIEVLGRPDGSIVVTVTDAPPRLSGLNEKGPIAMRIDMGAPVSAQVVHVRRPTLAAAPRRRAPLLDVPGQGGPFGFIRTGPVDAVFSSAQIDADEGVARALRDEARRSYAQLAVDFESAQPGFVPGRTITFAHAPRDRAGRLLAPQRLFGTSTWQLATVSHVFVGGHYHCMAEAEKSGAAWHPFSGSVDRRVHVVSATIDDGQSPAGEPVHPDRLGRLPVRPVFMPPWDAAVESPPVVPLISRERVGGAQHGFVSDARSGDVCRVEVHTPLSAEIVGYAYRDDRPVEAPVRDSSAGLVLHQGSEDWSGVRFGPHDTVAEREVARADADAAAREAGVSDDDADAGVGDDPDPPPPPTYDTPEVDAPTA